MYSIGPIGHIMAYAFSNAWGPTLGLMTMGLGLLSRPFVAIVLLIDQSTSMFI